MVNIIKKNTHRESFPKIGKLPSKPSKLIRIALDDLIKAEKKFNIDMTHWVTATDLRKCSVCLAGSVMTGTLKCKLPKFSHINDYSDSSLNPDDFVEADALYAINSFREGELLDAFEYLNIPFPINFKEGINIVEYSTNKDLFKEQMNELANALEKQGY